MELDLRPLKFFAPLHEEGKGNRKCIKRRGPWSEEELNSANAAKRSRRAARLAHTAAKRGDEGCLSSLGAATSLTAENNRGCTPAHLAAFGGHTHCLRILCELARRACLVAVNSKGPAPAHLAAFGGHAHCPHTLCELAGRACLAAVNNLGLAPAHVAAQNGHEGCLRTLDELGAKTSPIVADNNDTTLAHLAPVGGQAHCLRTLCELAGKECLLTTDSRIGFAPTHFAARKGHEGCLQVLHDIGAGARFSATSITSHTPAHVAAEQCREGCLRVLHECLQVQIEPAVDVWLESLNFFSATLLSSTAHERGLSRLDKSNGAEFPPPIRRHYPLKRFTLKDDCERWRKCYWWYR